MQIPGNALANANSAIFVITRRIVGVSGAKDFEDVRIINLPLFCCAKAENAYLSLESRFRMEIQARLEFRFERNIPDF